MTALNKYTDFLELGRPVTHKDLAVTPILLAEGAAAGPTFKSLDEAMRGKDFSVTEVSDEGSVPEVHVDNRSDDRILILSGEEIVGAKQNRVANVSVLVGEESGLDIPVSCIEQGRWGYNARSFSSAGRVHDMKTRGVMCFAVSNSMAASGGRDKRSDQGAVWREARSKLRQTRSASPTGSLSDAYEQRDADITDHVQAFTPTERQVGMIYTVKGRIMGLDLFRSPDLLAKSHAKLIRGAALQAIAEAEPEGLEISESEFMDRVRQADGQSFDGVGLGREIRLNGDNLTGAALIDEDRLAHLYAFATAPLAVA